MTGVERFIGGQGWDAMKGDEGKNILNGGGVVDNLHGRGGDDVFVVDTINGHDQGLLSNRHKGQYYGGDCTDTVNYEGLNSADYTQQTSPRLTINLGGKNSTSGETILNTGEKGNQTLHSLHDIEHCHRGQTVLLRIACTGIYKVRKIHTFHFVIVQVIT